MKEIDDRYPEIARPYEPVKGGKHYEKLKFPPFLLAAFLVVLLPAIRTPLSPRPNGPAPQAETILAVSTPEPVPSYEPSSPSPLPSSTPKPSPKPSPTPSPSPSPSPSPTPSFIPSPAPAPSPSPSYEPEPIVEEMIPPVPEPQEPEDSEEEPDEPTPVPDPRPDPGPDPQPSEGAPEISVYPEMSVLQDSSGQWANYRAFEVKLNDAWDGSAEVQLYVDEGSGYVSNGATGHAEYESGSAGEGGTWSNEVIYLFLDGSERFMKRNAKLVLTYKTKDGRKGKIESPVFRLYKGMFARFADASSGNGRAVFRYAVDPSITVPDALDLEYSFLEITGTGFIRQFSSPSSVNRTGDAIELIYETGELPENCEYSISAGFANDDGEGTVWTNFLSASGVLQ